jgi:hypothetical protein
MNPCHALSSYSLKNLIYYYLIYTLNYIHYYLIYTLNHIHYYLIYTLNLGARGAQLVQALRYNRKFAGSISDGVIGIFH